MIRVIAASRSLVVGGTNSVSVCDGGTLVDTNLVGERFPEQVLATAVLHAVPGKQAGLDGGHPLGVQSVLANIRVKQPLDLLVFRG